MDIYLSTSTAVNFFVQVPTSHYFHFRHPRLFWRTLWYFAPVWSSAAPCRSIAVALLASSRVFRRVWRSESGISSTVSAQFIRQKAADVFHHPSQLGYMSLVRLQPIVYCVFVNAAADFTWVLQLQLQRCPLWPLCSPLHFHCNRIAERKRAQLR